MQKAKAKLESCKAEREILVQDLKSVQVELIFFFVFSLYIYTYIFKFYDIKQIEADKKMETVLRNAREEWQKQSQQQLDNCKFLWEENFRMKMERAKEEWMVYHIQFNSYTL